MTTQEIIEFAEVWIKKFYPHRKATHFEHVEWTGEDYCIYFNRAVDGYNDWHFTEEYIINFTHTHKKNNQQQQKKKKKKKTV